MVNPTTTEGLALGVTAIETRVAAVPFNTTVLLFVPLKVATIFVVPTP